MSELDVYACLVLGARWSDTGLPSSAGWVGGPVPVPMPEPVRVPSPSPNVVADRETRAHFFSSRLRDLLYGRAPDEALGRWHRWVEQCDSPHGVVIEAAELLITRDGTVAVVHVRLGDDPIPALAALIAPTGPGRHRLATVVGPHVELTPARAQAVSHLLWENVPPGPPSQLPDDVGHAAGQATGLDWWGWFLAAGVTPADFVPEVPGPDWSDTRVALSRDWSAVVLRNGVCYVGRTARAASGDDFHAAARVYARTLHLDVFLLLLLQRNALRGLSDAVAALDLDSMNATAVQNIERDLLRVRTRLWFSDVTPAGGQTSDVLLALQCRHRLPQLYARLVEDLTDLSRYWASRTAAAEDAARRVVELARDEEERRARRLSNAVSLVSFFLLPLTVVYTGASLVADPSWALFLWSSALGLPPCVVALVYSLRS